MSPIPGSTDVTDAPSGGLPPMPGDPSAMMQAPAFGGGGDASMDGAQPGAGKPQSSMSEQLAGLRKQVEQGHGLLSQFGEVVKGITTQFPVQSDLPKQITDGVLALKKQMAQLVLDVMQQAQSTPAATGQPVPMR